MPTPHSEPGASRVVARSSSNSSSTRARHASGPSAMSAGSSRWARMSAVERGHSDVDARGAQVRDQQMPGFAMERQLAWRPPASAVAEPGVAHQAKVDQLAHALRDDGAPQARPRHELGTGARSAQSDLVEDGRRASRESPLAAGLPRVDISGLLRARRLLLFLTRKSIPVACPCDALPQHRRRRHRQRFYRDRAHRGASPYRRPRPRVCLARRPSVERSEPLASASRGHTNRSTICSTIRRVDVVHVTSPNHLHFPQVKQILAAGRHVVCEKPLAMTSEESAELVRLADGTDKVAAVNFNIRFYPAEPARARHRPRRRARRCASDQRPLLPGLAAHGDRLELAPRSRPRRRAARGGRHRLALARPDVVHHRAARRVRDGRPGDVHAPPPAAQGSGRDVLDRARQPTRCNARYPPRTRPPSCCATRAAREGWSACRRSAPAARTRCSTRSTARPARRRGTRSSPTSSGWAIATRPTRS